ncbi:MAG: aldehyde dehydrogenase [Frankia sp.]
MAHLAVAYVVSRVGRGPVTRTETGERIFIAGTWVRSSSGTRIDARSPVTEELIGSVAAASRADVDAATAAARHCLDDTGWTTLTPSERAAIVAPLSAALLGGAEALAQLVTAEIGCPITFSRAFHVPGAAMIVDYFTDLAHSTWWEQRRPGFAGDTLVSREPVGVVAAVLPWNLPLMSMVVKLVPALIAGCSVIVKAAPENALCASTLAGLIEELDLPPGAVSVLVADREVSEHLISDRRVDKVAFTGSTATGKRILEICARDVRRSTMELGGKSSAIVLDDADVESTVAGLIAGGMTQSGQMCVAQQRVLVPRRLEHEIREALIDRVSHLRVGDPVDEATDLGPLVAARQRDRVERLLHRAVQEGAKVLVGGGRPPEHPRGWFVEPTVLDAVTPDMTISREETFGPVLALTTYSDEDAAVAMANDSDFGLSGRVWTSDPDRGLGVARRLRTGTCGVNDASVSFNAPFGGFKQSGLGRELGPEGMEAFVEYRSIAVPARPA